MSKEIRMKFFGGRLSPNEHNRLRKTVSSIPRISITDWMILAGRVHDNNPELFREEWFRMMGEE